MRSPAQNRCLAALLTLTACTAALTAQGTAIGFEESYALAPDRSKVVANLIPGTEDWYYYQCRERLDARDFQTVREMLPTWIQRHGRTGRVIEIENREALLSFGDDPERTFAFLRQRLGLTFHHQRIVPGARSDLPQRLDATLVSPATLTPRAFALHPETVDGFTDRALATLANSNLDDEQLHSLLSRLERPDLPNLPALLVRDLNLKESRGFGSLPIHGELRLAQLEACLDLRQDLLQDARFVQAYLMRLQPDADTAWQHEPTAQAAYLGRLWQFATRLSPSFNSLKAHVLHHWLRHDLTQGAPDKQRFMNYIRLPRRQGHAAKAHLERFQRSAEFVDMSTAYPTLLATIGSDESLVQQCLEHFFASENGVEAYAAYLDSRWLERVLAETKILRGEGDMERWYSLLDDPTRLEQLEKQVELRFPRSLSEQFGADDAVRIEIDTKNVPKLLVKVFAIDSYRYHVEKQRPVDASIELDGVIANFEQTYTYQEPPMRRVRRAFDLPMLRDPGTYVVEFVGNGISSRAVVHKGGLRMVERTAAAGQVVRVYDERGEHLTRANVWFGGREYKADEQGEILVPFSTDPGQKKLVLRYDNRSSLVSFAHRAESYTLQNSVYVDREAIVAGRTARLLVHPQLQLASHPMPLSLLTEPRLTIVATDIDGLSTTQELRDLQLSDDGEFVHEFRVPQRLLSLQVSLAGTVKGLDGKPVALATPSEAFAVNGIDRTAETSTPLMLRTTAGYIVELRGKNGEIQSGRVCRLNLYHRDYRDAISVALQTDEQGRIQLGALPGIERVQVQKDGASGGTFELADATCRVPRELHGTPGDTLRVPYQGERKQATRIDFSLLGHDRDAFDHVALVDGFVELRHLPPGDYVLLLHATGARVDVRITDAERDGDWLVGRDRVLAASNTRPLQVQGMTVEGDDLRIHLSNASGNTRVHVVATRYMPAFDAFARLAGADAEDLAAVELERTLSSYHAGRKLSDEYRYVLERRFATKYAGNMLQRPSLLLNPWALSDESWNTAIGLGGGAGGAYGGRSGGRSKRRGGEGDDGRPGAGPNPGIHANLDFLPDGSTMLANLRPGKDGFVRVPLLQLGTGQQVHVLALDGTQIIYDSMVRAEQRLQPRARVLPAALDVSKHFAEHKRIEFVAAGGTAALDDARSAQVEIHDSLASVYRLFSTISGGSWLPEFAFLLEWPQLKRARQLELYDGHACHELHFFLHQKDREFFDSVVRPFLANKLDKTFLDHWLLEHDLRAYLEPWQFARLNVIEKILLAQRIDGAEREAVARSLREALELKPLPQKYLEDLFDLALKSEQLANSHDTLRAGLSALTKFRSKAPEPAGGGGAAKNFKVGRPAPSGPATEGPAGPTTGGLPTERPSADEDKQVYKDEIEESFVEQLERAPNQEAGALRELAQRKSVRQLYRAVKSTELLVEHNYWHRRIDEPSTDVVRANSFWIDYATAAADKPFVSAAIVEATGSFLEMMMALSVLDLPFAAGKHEVVTDGDRRTLRAATPLLLVRKEIEQADTTTDGEPLLLGQNAFRLDNRYRFENGQRRDAFVSDEFLVDVAYGCQVVVTNPTSSQRSVNVLLQIPAGSMPLRSGFWTRGVSVQLEPYQTRALEYSFYFPDTGAFAHYPAQAADKGKLLASTEAKTLQVVAAPSKLDTSSWQHVSQQGSPTEVLTFLDGHNVQRFDLDKIAWRMRDREFFAALLPKLRARHVYNDTLWSYSLLHRDQATTREYLRHQDGFLNQCGTWLESTLASIDPKQRSRFQHVELDPLVHSRAHQVGGTRVFGNRDLARQYGALMDLLGYRPRLDSDDWLSVTYYFLLQDRTEDALRSFQKIDANRIAARVQYDYLSAYLCFYTGDTQKARRLAEPNREHPVARWRQRFRDVLAQLDEAEGKTRPATDEPTADMLAATAPALELAVEGRGVALSYKNLTACEVRYYELDVEFAFSGQPFAGPDGASAAFVRPNLSEKRDLPDGKSQLTFELPQQFWRKNVLVEVRGEGLVRSRQYFANALDVRFLESYGQVAVSEPTTNKPLARTYVKVFVKLRDGQVRFHKDGYTDLRGRFDYASLSDDPNRGAVSYAVLVLDEQRGAVIREIDPPTR